VEGARAAPRGLEHPEGAVYEGGGEAEDPRPGPAAPRWRPHPGFYGNARRGGRVSGPPPFKPRGVRWPCNGGSTPPPNTPAPWSRSWPLPRSPPADLRARKRKGHLGHPVTTGIHD